MSDGKLSMGQMWKPYPTAIHNALAEVAQWWLTSRGVQDKSMSIPYDPCRMSVKNNSGSDVAAGKVLEIGDKLLTTLDKRQLSFAGTTPTPDAKKIWGVAEFPIPAGQTGKMLVSGLAVVVLNINDADHVFADVNNSVTLQTAWHGMPIVNKPSGTGSATAVIRMGTIYTGPFDCVITQSGGIAGGSSGTADVKWNGSTIESITVYNDWMDGGVSVGLNAESRFNWQPDRQKYVLVGADCT